MEEEKVIIPGAPVIHVPRITDVEVESEGGKWAVKVGAGETVTSALDRVKRDYADRKNAGGPAMLDGEGAVAEPQANIIATKDTKALEANPGAPYPGCSIGPRKAHKFPPVEVQQAGWYEPDADLIREHFPEVYKTPQAKG